MNYEKNMKEGAICTVQRQWK